MSPFALTLLVSALIAFLFPFFSLENTHYLVGLPLLGFAVDFIFSRQNLRTKLLPISFQQIISLILIFLLVAQKERSEFLHFDVAPAVDIPVSHLALILVAAISIYHSKSRFWFLAIGIASVFHLFSSIGDVYNFSILPVSFLSIYLLIGSFFTTSTLAWDRRVGAFISILSFLILSVFLIDAVRLTQRPLCGKDSLNPPDKLVRVLLAAEDPRFYQHRGVDIHRLRMAVREAIKSKELGRGGSTLTMQYAKICLLNPEKTLIRKARQIVLALILELYLSKSEILSRYLTAVPFGEGTIGIEDAANHYYSKPLTLLKESEMLSLVLSIFDPEISNPNIELRRSELSRWAVIKVRSRSIFIPKKNYLVRE